jgi:hypothetical protein
LQREEIAAVHQETGWQITVKKLADFAHNLVNVALVLSAF